MPLTRRQGLLAALVAAVPQARAEANLEKLAALTQGPAAPLSGLVLRLLLALADGQPEVIPRFVAVPQSDAHLCIAFLEDTSLMTRQAERHSWSMRASEIAAIDEALLIYSVQLQHISLHEYETAVANALRTAHQALAGNAAAGVVMVCCVQSSRALRTARAAADTDGATRTSTNCLCSPIWRAVASSSGRLKARMPPKAEVGSVFQAFV